MVLKSCKFLSQAVQMAMSKSWLRDLERWEVAEDPTAFLADVASMGMGLWDMWRRYKTATSSNQNGFCADEPNNIGRAVGEVIAITGCASDQTSADVGDVHSEFDLKPSQGGGHLRVSRTSAGGALTSAFIEAMDASQGRVTYLNLLEHLRGRLADAGYSQASASILSLFCRILPFPTLVEDSSTHACLKILEPLLGKT